MTRIRTWWPLGLATSVLLACTVSAIRAALGRTDGHLVYALDDTYTHMAMARTVAEHGLWGCTPFHFGSASSSPLWVVLLAAVGVIAGVRDAAPMVLNVVFAVVSLGVADFWLRRATASALLRAATLVGLVLVLPMPAMALYGMEHMLHTFLTIAFAAAAAAALSINQRREAPSHRETLVLAVMAALLGASRYEGLFLVGLVCVVCVLVGRWRQGVAIGAVAALPAVTLGLVSLANGSLFLPNPLVIKAGGEGASMMATLFKPIGGADWAALQQNPRLLGVVIVGGIAALVEAARPRGIRRVSVLLPVLLVLSVALHVHFAFSSAFWVYRYDAYLEAFAVFAGGAVLAQAAAAWPGPRWISGVLSAAAVTGAVFALGDVRNAVTSENEIDATSTTYREHYHMAQFVRTYFPGQVVVVNDIGVMAYRSEADALDMFGLCNIEPVLERRGYGGYTKDDVQDWTDPRRPRIAILQLGWGWVRPRIPDSWRPVAVVHVLPEGHTLGFFAIAPDVPGVELRADIEEFYRPLVEPLGYRIQYF